MRVKRGEVCEAGKTRRDDAISVLHGRRWGIVDQRRGGNSKTQVYARGMGRWHSSRRFVHTARGREAGFTAKVHLRDMATLLERAAQTSLKNTYQNHCMMA